MEQNVDSYAVADHEDVRFIRENIDVMRKAYSGKCVLVVNACVVKLFDDILSAWHYTDAVLPLAKYAMADFSGPEEMVICDKHDDR